ncbi:MAG: ADP-ribosylglycohydrolase family protein [Bacteroidota bacterium]
MRKAISLGGDSDTLACITCGIAQAYYQEDTSRDRRAGYYAPGSRASHGTEAVRGEIWGLSLSRASLGVIRCTFARNLWNGTVYIKPCWLCGGLRAVRSHQFR